MTHYGLNDCTNLSNIIDIMNSLTNRVLAHRLVQWSLGWVFETQERKNERKKERNADSPGEDPRPSGGLVFFWFLVCYAATQLATQLQQRCIQVVRSNKEARKRLTKSNGTPAMDLGHIVLDLSHPRVTSQKNIELKQHPLCTVIKSGFHHPRQKERKIRGGHYGEAWYVPWKFCG